MPPAHIALCLLACLLWAGNFIAVKIGLDAHMTPLLMTAMRFSLASCLLPFVRRPAGMTCSSIALIGLVIGVGQFGLATLSVSAGVSAGIVALILQTQVFLTIGLAALWLREPISYRVMVGSAVALLGVALLLYLGAADSSRFSPIGWLLALGAAGAAALGNVLVKRQAGAGNAFRLAVWIAPFPVLPLLGLSCLTEASPVASLLQVHRLPAVAAIVYGGLLSAVAGTAIWAWLLRRHPASRVALYTPSIPVFAFVLSALVFGQFPGAQQACAAGIVLLGMVLASTPSPWRIRFRHIVNDTARTPVLSAG